jgi:hypothetical protein
MAPTAATTMATTQASKNALIAVLPKPPGFHESLHNLHKMARPGQCRPAPLKSLCSHCLLISIGPAAASGGPRWPHTMTFGERPKIWHYLQNQCAITWVEEGMVLSSANGSAGLTNRLYCLTAASSSPCSMPGSTSSHCPRCIIDGRSGGSRRKCSWQSPMAGGRSRSRKSRSGRR